MQIPETPTSIGQLDLMKRLDSYAKGRDTWLTDGNELGPSTRSACGRLHSNLVELVEKVLVHLLDTIPTREMQVFTIHDRRHGLKVAHLMWHILSPERQKRLTPPEIGIMVAAAFLHDLGMALDDNERANRLASPELWEKLELQSPLKDRIDSLEKESTDTNLSDSQKRLSRQKLTQAQEALLAQDTRDRHATEERYKEIFEKLKKINLADHSRIPDIGNCLTFDDQSFQEKLVDVCVSHNEDAASLANHRGMYPRFRTDYPVGCSIADLHMIAAALRLADILDFDRERTPPVLFHYLLPCMLGDLENHSVLEWNKHLAISNWQIEENAIIFRGRCSSNIIHHTIVLFKSIITQEIEETKLTFKNRDWPFILPLFVNLDIIEEDYKYVPYHFELDDDRIYELSMGGAIYDDPLVAVRELIQNAVDACKLRDALNLLSEPYIIPSKDNRITIRYEEATASFERPCLIVKDTGIGMDQQIIERWFLKVGQSYYRSTEFTEIRIKLRKRDLDFAPVSEFGIGFLSSFLLADRVKVETATSEFPQRDNVKRILTIDGPTRLIGLNEEDQDKNNPFKGTQVTLYLSRSQQNSEDSTMTFPTWEKIKSYLEDVCLDLEYTLDLEYVKDGNITRDCIKRCSNTIDIPSFLQECILRIEVNDQEAGLRGEIVLINPYLAEQKFIETSKLNSLALKIGKDIESNTLENEFSEIIRGGFRICEVPGLPKYFSVEKRVDGELAIRLYCGSFANARIWLTWESNPKHRFLLTNLARNSLANQAYIASRIERRWMTYLIEHADTLPYGQLFYLCANIHNFTWLEQYNAYKLYRLARQGWFQILENIFENQKAAIKGLEEWEQGNGSPLPITNSNGLFCIKLLHRLLPKITSLQMNSNSELFVKVPTRDWIAILERWKSYISSPVEWEPFVEYTGDIENFLCCPSPISYFLNIRFREMLSSFQVGEIQLLARICESQIIAHQDGMTLKLDPHEAKLFSRLVELAGHLEIGNPRTGTWRLDSFAEEIS